MIKKSIYRTQFFFILILLANNSLTMYVGGSRSELKGVFDESIYAQDPILYNFKPDNLIDTINLERGLEANFIANKRFKVMRVFGKKLEKKIRNKMEEIKLIKRVSADIHENLEDAKQTKVKGILERLLDVISIPVEIGCQIFTGGSMYIRADLPNFSKVFNVDTFESEAEKRLAVSENKRAELNQLIQQCKEESQLTDLEEELYDLKSSVEQEMIHLYELQYIKKKKRFFDKQLCKRIERAFLIARDTNAIDEFEYKEYFEKILALPTTVTIFLGLVPDIDMEEYFKKFDKNSYLNNFDSDTQKQLKKIMCSWIYNEHQRPQTFYNVGLPETGKRTSFKELAKILCMPIYEVSLRNANQLTEDNLYGTPFSLSETSSIGWLALALSEKTFSNFPPSKKIGFEKIGGMLKTLEKKHSYLGIQALYDYLDTIQELIEFGDMKYAEFAPHFPEPHLPNIEFQYAPPFKFGFTYPNCSKYQAPFIKKNLQQITFAELSCIGSYIDALERIQYFIADLTELIKQDIGETSCSKEKKTNPYLKLKNQIYLTNPKSFWHKF